MRSGLFVLLASSFLFSATAFGQSYTPVKHSELQELYLNTDLIPPAYESYFHNQHTPPARFASQVIGVVINNPGDMLNYTFDAESNPKPQWQTYIQAINPVSYGISFDNEDGAWDGFFNNWNDFGGTAMYMGMFAPWGPTIYTSAQWGSETQVDTEMYRVNNPLFYPSIEDEVRVSLKAGDVVQVKAKAPGVYYNGKYNINERHASTTQNDFEITVLAENFDLSNVVSNISLSDLKDSDDNFIFDLTEQDGKPGFLTRGSGCEHYQATLVHLDNLIIQNPSAWNLYDPKHPIIVQDADDATRTFSMVLGVNPALELVDAAALANTPFSITAILDQEGGVSDGYRLWLMDASGLPTVPEPSGIILIITCTLGWLFWRRRFL